MYVRVSTVHADYMYDVPFLSKWKKVLEARGQKGDNKLKILSFTRRSTLFVHYLLCEWWIR